METLQNYYVQIRQGLVAEDAERLSRGGRRALGVVLERLVRIVAHADERAPEAFALDEGRQEGVNDARVGLEERRAVDRARHRRREEFLDGRWVVIAQRQRRNRGE